MPKGEAKVIEYNPGQKPTQSLPVDDGAYALALKSKGRPGPKGWRKKSPKSYPNRMLVFKILNTEDEITGNEKEVVEFASLSPGFSLQKIAFLAYAAGYPKKLKLESGPKKKPNDPTVMRNMKAVDELLQYIEDNEVELRAYLAGDSYNGEDRNKVAKWLPPDAELDSSSDDAEETEDEETEEAEGEESDDEGGDESEDEGSEDESEEESEEASEDEEAEEESEDEDEEAEEVDDESEETEESDEAEEAEESEPEETEEEPEEKPAKSKKGSELDSPAVKKAKAKQAAEKAKAAAKKGSKKKSKK
jgi:hypothetical protein